MNNFICDLVEKERTMLRKMLKENPDLSLDGLLKTFPLLSPMEIKKTINKIKGDK